MMGLQVKRIMEFSNNVNKKSLTGLGTHFKIYPFKSGHNLDSLKKSFRQNLFATKNKSSIYQREFNGGVAQLVRARDS